jgi:hypothetical protein
MERREREAVESAERRGDMICVWLFRNLISFSVYSVYARIERE